MCEAKATGGSDLNHVVQITGLKLAVGTSRGSVCYSILTPTL